MAETGDILARSLDSLGVPGAAPAPPAPYLRAVGHRRVQRRVRRASIAAGLLLIAGVGAFFASPFGAPGQRAAGTLADAHNITTGAYHYYNDASPEALPRSEPAKARGAIYASDWRSESKLAALIGNS